jgi:hypothetical protein
MSLLIWRGQIGVSATPEFEPCPLFTETWEPIWVRG